jgi:hypothetical protein
VANGNLVHVGTKRTPSVGVGAAVVFALDRKTAFVRKADGTEYRLLIVKKTPRMKSPDVY